MNPTKDPFINACFSGDIAVVGEYLKDKNNNINLVIGKRYQVTPLIAACRARQLPIVLLLLNDNRLDINQNVNNGDSKLNALDEAFYNGSINIAKLVLVDPRTDKWNIFELINKVCKHAGSEFISKEFRLESLKKLLILLLDQSYRGFEILQYFHINETVDFVTDNNWSTLSIPEKVLNEPQSEEEIIFFAYLLFLTKRKDCSCDSLVMALLELTPPARRDSEQDIKFKERFKLVYDKFNLSHFLPTLLAEMKEEAFKLAKTKSLPKIKNATYFLNNFFSNPAVKNSEANQFTEAFQSLLPEIQKIVAGYLFQIPNALMFKINNADIIKKEDEELHLLKPSL